MAFWSSLFTLALGLSVLGNVNGAPSFTCTSFMVPIPIANVTTIVPPFPYPLPDGYAATSFCNAVTARDAPALMPMLSSISETFNISVEYCTPKRPSARSTTLQILTHGFGFDKSYWDFHLPSKPKDNQYSYASVALAAGYSTLSWDRIGCGLSSTPDPYTIVQAPVQLAILATLTESVRKGAIKKIPAPQKVIHVGHSFGSLLTNALAAAFPTLSDAIVMTAYSHNFTWGGELLISTTCHVAAENQPHRFGNFSTGYITWGDKYDNQYSFLSYPYFDPAVLTYAESVKFPFTLGEIITMTAVNLEASDFTGPVLYLEAEHDLIFCGGDCKGLLGIQSSAVKAFGNASSVQTYIQPNVGHGINLHKNATAAYKVITTWAESHGF